MVEYLVPTQFGEGEFVEKKSRFIGRLAIVDSILLGRLRQYVVGGQ